MSKKKKKKKSKSHKKPQKPTTPNTNITLTPKGYALFGNVPIESGALQQMEDAMSLPVTLAGALMPDAHEGYGLPIGGVIATDNVVIPYAVGMDIGCRMTLTIYETEPDFLDRYRDMLKSILIQHTRFGTDEFEDHEGDPVLERPEFREIKFLRKHYQTAVRQFGTSGRGNHFVEFGEVTILSDDNPLGLKAGKYFGILSHSGSRHFGYEIAKHYSKIAEEKLGLTGNIRRLSWLELDSEEGQEYWRAMNLAGDYARANHHYIHRRLARAIGIQPVKLVENHHNFAWKEMWNGREVIVHRKGATPAHKGALGIIPGDMVSPAYIVQGRGNERSLNSASHGAGRAMSRRKAKQTFTRKDLEQVLKKAGVELLGGGLDEVPMAYKDINQVIAAQSDLVDIIARFQPRIVRME